MKIRLHRKVAIALVLFAVCGLAAAESYETRLLYPSIHTNSRAFAINSTGQIVGLSNQTNTPVIRPMVWNGTAKDLGTLGGMFGTAIDINNSGYVVGWSYAGPTSNYFNFLQHATLWKDGVATDLGTLGGSTSSASAINNMGQIVGSAYTKGDTTAQATLWNGSTIIALDNIGGSYGTASGINDAGQVAGTAYTVGNTGTAAVRWTGTAATVLGTLGGSLSSAFAINNAGQVVGQSSRTGTDFSHATLWNSVSAIDLGTLGGIRSSASDINNAGQVVGWSDVIGKSASRATLWNGTSATDLNNYLDSRLANEGWVLTSANSINEAGAIVGTANNSLTGQYLGFVLTAPVPEPQTYALMLAGLGLIAGIARRRSKRQ